MGCTTSTKQQISEGPPYSLPESSCLDTTEAVLKSSSEACENEKTLQKNIFVDVDLILKEGVSVLLSRSSSDERAILSILVNDEISSFVAVRPRRITIAPSVHPLNVYIVIVPSSTFDALECFQSLSKVRCL